MYTHSYAYAYDRPRFVVARALSRDIFPPRKADEIPLQKIEEEAWRTQKATIENV